MHTYCRHAIAIIAAFATLFWANASHALTPESGWWWNEAESGRGFSIELQNNTIFMSGFLYEASGAPLWFVASGPYSQTANSFEGDMLSLRGGQCITCSYRAATIQPSLGRIQLRFASPSTANMTWPGGNLAIKRQIYGVASDIEKMFGSFAFSTAGTSNRVHFGNWLTFSRTINDPGLGKVAVGSTESGRTALAAFTNAERTAILVLVDASTSFYESYLIPVSFFGSREGSGLWSTYLKTQTAPLPNAYAHIARIFAASAAPVAPMAMPSDSPKAQVGALQSTAATTELNADAQRLAESKLLSVTKQNTHISALSNPDAAAFDRLATLIKAPANR